MARKKRKRKQITCQCTAYKFPHRFGGGKCSWFRYANHHWNQYYGHCQICAGCNSFVEGHCEVVTGQESAKYCAALQEFLEYEKP